MQYTSVAKAAACLAARQSPWETKGVEAPHPTVRLCDSSDLFSPIFSPPFHWAEIPWYFAVS